MHPFTKEPRAHGFFLGLRAVALCSALLVGCGLGLGLTGCSETQRVSIGDCGNRIVELGEDCDGQEGCDQTCHFNCSASQSCPAGWGCDGGAGICRAALGTFRPPLVLGASRFVSLLVRDFDADGRDDLLAYSPSQGEASSVFYFDAAGAVESTLELPAAFAVASADVTGDKTPDVVVSGEGTSVFRASTARKFSPLVGALQELSPHAKLLAADLDCSGSREILLLGGNGPATDSTLFRVDFGGALLGLDVELKLTALQLSELEKSDPGFLLVQRDLTATGSFATAAGRCDMLALPAPPGTFAVDVYGSPDGNGHVEAMTRIRYPGERLPERWFFADLDADGNADLVIASDFETWLSRGLGGGQFEPSASPLEGSEPVLAAGTLDAAAGDDLFTQPNIGQLYRQARAVELTGDALTDVVAVGSQRRVDVYRGHPTGRLSRLSVPLRGVPRLEDVGDFDGDGAQDLLLSDGDDDAGPRQRASIVFSPVASDAAAVEVASFASIEQLAAGYVDVDSVQGEAAMSIGVLFASDDSKLQLGLMEGGADRLLRSRLPQNMDVGIDFAPSVPALGRFHESAGLELAMVSGLPGQPVRVDLLGVTKSGIIPKLSVFLDGFDYQLLEQSRNAGVLTLNLDGDDEDELYVRSSAGLLQLESEGDGFFATRLFPDMVLSRIDAQDADGDGVLDLVAVADTQLSVLLAVRSGKPKRHDFPVEAFGCGDSLSPDLAFIQADTDPERELMFRCLPSLDGKASIDLETRLFDVDLSKDELRDYGGVPNVATGRLVTGDFNGDGVQDFAGGSPELSVFFGEHRE